MRSVTLIPFAFVTQAHAKDFIDGSVDKLVDSLLNRVLKVSPNQNIGMDRATLGKPGHPAIPFDSSPTLGATLGKPVQSGFPLRSTPPFFTSHLPPHFPQRAELEPVPSIIARSSPLLAPNFPPRFPIGHLEDWKPKSSVHRLAKSPGAISPAVAEADAKSTLETIWDKPPVIPQYGEVIEVHSEDDFDKCLQQSSGIVMLEVTQKMCRACRVFAQKYKSMAVDYYGKVKFLKMVGNENESTLRVIAKRLKVKLTPSFYVFRDGEVLAEVAGSNETKVRSTLDECLLQIQV